MSRLVSLYLMMEETSNTQQKKCDFKDQRSDSGGGGSFGSGVLRTTTPGFTAGKGQFEKLLFSTSVALRV